MTMVSYLSIGAQLILTSLFPPQRITGPLSLTQEQARKFLSFPLNNSSKRSHGHVHLKENQPAWMVREIPQFCHCNQKVFLVALRKLLRHLIILTMLLNGSNLGAELALDLETGWLRSVLRVDQSLWSIINLHSLHLHRRLHNSTNHLRQWSFRNCLTREQQNQRMISTNLSIQ